MEQGYLRIPAAQGAKVAFGPMDFHLVEVVAVEAKVHVAEEAQNIDSNSELVVLEDPATLPPVEEAVEVDWKVEAMRHWYFGNWG